jgi:hypothetical protein
VVGRVYIGTEETLEDSFFAELVTEQHRGMAFGTLATVNGVSDFVSNAVVGLLWATFPNLCPADGSQIGLQFPSLFHSFRLYYLITTAMLT